jgi:hypothetical protein
MVILLAFLLMAGILIGIALQNDKKNQERVEEARLRAVEIDTYNRGFRDGMNATLKQMPAGTKVELKDILMEMECFK